MLELYSDPSKQASVQAQTKLVFLFLNPHFEATNYLKISNGFQTGLRRKKSHSYQKP